jgi:hypothetical protein
MLNMNFYKRILFISLFFLSSVSFTQLITNDSINILFIGNSYTHMNNMPAIFDKIANAKGKLVHVEKNTQSGASFQVHTTRLDLYESIKSRNWDFIVLQGYSRELSHTITHIDSATIPFLNQIIDTINLYNPCVNLLLYNTWGYKYGFADREEINSYDKMQDSIIKGYRYLNTIYNIPIVPVGMVWRNVIKANPKLNLYKEDNEHPNKIGSYLSACTFFSAIFKESPEGAVTSTISAEHAKIVQVAAFKYVLTNYTDLNLDLNRSSLSYYRTSDVKYIVECKSNYPNAMCIMWDFDDGEYSSSPNPIYRYKKPGKYKVKLYIDDVCGERVYEKKIIFSKPNKPKKPIKSAPIVTPTSKKKI